MRGRVEGFEFSVGRVVEFLELKPILAARLGLDASSILTEDDYWGRSDSSAFAGVSIEYVNGGFRHLLMFIAMRSSMVKR